MKRKRPSFQHACSTYVYRHTMDHVPEWATKPISPGKFYAPQYRSDQEWYERTKFPGEPGHIGRITECYSSNASWPLGMWLAAPFKHPYTNIQNASATNREEIPR